MSEQLSPEEIEKEYADWHPEQSQEQKPFMTRTGEKFKALLPVEMGLALLVMAGQQAEAAPNAAVEKLKREEGMEMFATAGVVEKFMPEAVKTETINGVLHKRIEADVRLGDKLFDLYLASPTNQKELNKWDHWEKRRDIYVDFKKDLEKRYPKQEGMVKKIIRTVSERFMKWGGGAPSDEKPKGPTVNGKLINEAQVIDLVTDVKTDLLITYEATKSLDKKAGSEILSKVKEVETSSAKEFTAHWINEENIATENK